MEEREEAAEAKETAAATSEEESSLRSVELVPTVDCGEVDDADDDPSGEVSSNTGAGRIGDEEMGSDGECDRAVDGHMWGIDSGERGASGGRGGMKVSAIGGVMEGGSDEQKERREEGRREPSR